MPDGRKGPGRPALPEHERKRFNLTFRVRADLKERLTAAAQSNGRSLSEEIEVLLERSVQRDEMMQGFFGQRLTGLMALISSVIMTVQKDTGKRIETDVLTATIVERVISTLCHEFFKVPGAPGLSPEERSEAERFASELAGFYLEMFADMVKKNVAPMSRGGARSA